MKKKRNILLLALLFGVFVLYRNVSVREGSAEGSVTATIIPGMTVAEIGEMLEREHIVYSGTMLRRYLSWKKLDTKIQNGEVTFEAPFTIRHAANTLVTRQSAPERTITILPGWDLRQIGEYFESEGIVSLEDWYAEVGEPLDQRANTAYTLQSIEPFQDVPDTVNLEGYIRPDTYRIFSNASVHDIVDKLVRARADQFTSEMISDIKRQGKTIHEILTMASIIEREVRTPEDRRVVSDLFWRRESIGMALQADSTVHYITGTEGSVFTSSADRDIDSPWNTYQYPGLPRGPISNPSLDAIMASIYPEENEYWYFLTTLDTGEVKYGRTLDEHNANVAKYLR